MLHLHEHPNKQDHGQTEWAGAVPGLQDGVRKVILDSYSRTCRKVSKAVLADSLRLDSAAVDELVSLH